MLLALAEHHGIGEEVAAAVKGKRGPKREKLGPMLKAARLARGDNIKRVHERCNLARSTISDLENDESRAAPGIRTIQALSYGYRVPFIRVLLAALNTFH